MGIGILQDPPMETEGLDAYERILLDCMQGDRMLFVREDCVELCWQLLSPAIGRSEEGGNAPRPYAAGSAGPAEAEELLRRDGREWADL